MAEVVAAGAMSIATHRPILRSIAPAVPSALSAVALAACAPESSRVPPRFSARLPLPEGATAHFGAAPRRSRKHLHGTERSKGNFDSSASAPSCSGFHSPSPSPSLRAVRNISEDVLYWGNLTLRLAT